MFKKILIIPVLLVFSGCSTISNTISKISSYTESSKYTEGIESYVKDFPKLTEEIKYVKYDEMHQKCGAHKPPGKEMAKVYGCSEIDLIKKTCTIFLTENYEQWALDHEKEHCKGGDHDGILQSYYDKWIKLSKETSAEKQK